MSTTSYHHHTAKIGRKSQNYPKVHSTSWKPNPGSYLISSIWHILAWQRILPPNQIPWWAPAVPSQGNLLGLSDQVNPHEFLFPEANNPMISRLTQARRNDHPLQRTQSNWNARVDVCVRFLDIWEILKVKVQAATMLSISICFLFCSDARILPQ